MNSGSKVVRKTVLLQKLNIQHVTVSSLKPWFTTVFFGSDVMAFVRLVRTFHNNFIRPSSWSTFLSILIVLKSLYHKQLSGRKLRVHARLEAFSFRNLRSTYVVSRSAGDIYIYFPKKSGTVLERKRMPETRITDSTSIFMKTDLKEMKYEYLGLCY